MVPNLGQALAAHCPLFHYKNVSFECGRHALHAAALQARGVAFADLRSQLLRFRFFWVRT